METAALVAIFEQFGYIGIAFLGGGILVYLFVKMLANSNEADTNQQNAITRMVETMQSDIRDLQSDNRKLHDDNRALHSTNSKLLTRVNQMAEREHKIVQVQLTTQKEMQRLQNAARIENLKWRSRYNRQRAAVVTLAKQVKRLQERVKELQADNQEIKETRDRYRDERDRFRLELDKLRLLNNKLEGENTRLARIVELHIERAADTKPLDNDNVEDKAA